jgi:hypothetical protein
MRQIRRFADKVCRRIRSKAHLWRTSGRSGTAKRRFSQTGKA